MIAMLIGQKEIDKAKALIAFATDNVISFERLNRMVAEKEAPIGDDPRFTMEIPVGYRIVYSHEDQKGVLCKHISISHDKSMKLDKFPPLAAVNQIIEMFGFAKVNESQIIYEDKYVKAINIVERIM